MTGGPKFKKKSNKVECDDEQGLNTVLFDYLVTYCIFFTHLHNQLILVGQYIECLFILLFGTPLPSKVVYLTTRVDNLKKLIYHYTYVHVIADTCLIESKFCLHTNC